MTTRKYTIKLEWFLVSTITALVGCSAADKIAHEDLLPHQDLQVTNEADADTPDLDVTLIDASLVFDAQVDRLPDMTVVPPDLYFAPDADTIPAPQQLSPLSGATVTQQRPTFHWSTLGGHVEVYTDHACVNKLTEFDSDEDSGAPSVNLPSGTLYWLVRGKEQATVGLDASAVWEVHVPSRSSGAVDTSWGSRLDVNADGFDDLLVGAPQANGGVGEVYVYLGGANGLQANPTLLSSPAGAGGQFGYSVASAGDVNGDGYTDVVIGAPTAMSSQGAAFVYYGSASGINTTSATTLLGVVAGSDFGISVSTAGDVDGDGYADVVVGAPLEVNNRGTAYIFHGAADGILPTTLDTQVGNGQQVWFGVRVAAAGDANGDTYGDIAVSAWGCNGYSIGCTTGYVAIFLGSSSGLVAQSSLLTWPTGTVACLFGACSGQGFASDVRFGGDINGDGYSDLLVGQYASGYSEGGEDGQHLLEYQGYSGGIFDVPARVIGDPDQQHQAGNEGFDAAIAGIGDLNGDGYSDVNIGSRGDNSCSQNPYFYCTSGSVRSYLGTHTSIDATATPADQSNQEGYGTALAIGDINGDGAADLIVGVPNFNDTANGGSSTAGKITIYLGQYGGTPTYSADIATPDGITSQGLFGFALSTAN